MAKQQELIEGRGIKELDDAAEKVADLTSARMELLAEEIKARDALLGLMKKHQRNTYVYNGKEVLVTEGKEKVSVRTLKDKNQAKGDKQ